MISLETQSTHNSYYETSFSAPRTGLQRLIEEIEKGNHQIVIDYLRTGGSLSDHEEYYPTSLGFYCFRFLDLSQIKEILSVLPEETELPSDSVIWIQYDSKGEQIDRFLELLPFLEKCHYPFEEIYERVLENLNLKWIEFFLAKDIPNLDLNCPVTNDGHITIHPYTHLKILAGRIFIYRLFIKYAEEADFEEEEFQREKDEIIQMSEQIEQILHKMESHPKIDFKRVQNEMNHFRAKGIYFMGDPELESGCRLMDEAATFEGLEKLVAQGFNLYESIGPFFAEPLWLEDDSTWIEVFSNMYGEYELVELMTKYQSK